MVMPPPISTLTDTLLPSPTLFRSPRRSGRSFWPLRGVRLVRRGESPDGPDGQGREHRRHARGLGGRHSRLRRHIRRGQGVPLPMKRLVDFLGFHAFMLAIVGVLAGSLYALGAVVRALGLRGDAERSEEHTSELQSLMRISYAVFCLQK